MLWKKQKRAVKRVCVDKTRNVCWWSISSTMGLGHWTVLCVKQLIFGAEMPTFQNEKEASIIRMGSAIHSFIEYAQRAAHRYKYTINT